MNTEELIKIKEAYVQRAFAILGVQGLGVGAHGLRVYVLKDAYDEQTKKEITALFAAENIPFEIVLSGKITALA